ncbi:ADP-dependent (S)-NAD(P)H-hydrate dehydratase [Flavobacterium sp. 9AF]|uniref:NAD(P)H-hydrate dehydratase n=1 Tax=Flavobacterium sp. 9AF TaxID=2653142 RepID=UPI0012F1A7C8|nr:NAD(P)H-hydrate dehydratase [Flavobacterium sp. 9AF]VXC10382.1 ADP-dependent (S)-NAD(P)H-hydrate dehydratase [Flavobacterium sp. 9AF]
MQKIDLSFIQTVYKKRVIDSHKGTHGHALLIAGSTNKIGAALIASKSCLRIGVGLLTTNIPKDEKIALNSFLPEAMIEFRENNIDFSKYDAIGVGPGINTNEESQKIVFFSLLKNNKNIILDADALNILAENKDWCNQLPKDTVLTPHPKEFDRLFGNHYTNDERQVTAINKANEMDVIIVLKGAKTFITNGKETFENTTGNSGLAKAGSGDALTGIITGLLAQKYTPLQASILGVFLHGLAADITLKTQSVESMLITDVIENLGLAFKKLEE